MTTATVPLAMSTIGWTKGKGKGKFKGKNDDEQARERERWRRWDRDNRW